MKKSTNYAVCLNQLTWCVFFLCFECIMIYMCFLLEELKVMSTWLVVVLLTLCFLYLNLLSSYKLLQMFYIHHNKLNLQNVI